MTQSIEVYIKSHPEASEAVYNVARGLAKMEELCLAGDAPEEFQELFKSLNYAWMDNISLIVADADL